jgi:hypothetical protein
MSAATQSRSFRVEIRQQRDGYVVASCASPVCIARGRSEAEVLEKIRAEIRYRIELCPCTGVTDDYVQIEAVYPSARP